MFNQESKLIKTITSKESRDFSQRPNNVPSSMITTKMPSAKTTDVALEKYFLQFGICIF